MANGNGNRLALLRNTGNFMKRAGPRGNLANRMGFDDDEEESTLITDRTTPFTDYLIKDRQPPSTRDYFAHSPHSSLAPVIAGGQRDSRTGPESPSDVSTSSTGVPSKMALTAADEFMLSPGEIDFSPTAMAAPPMPEKRVFEETTPAEGPRSFWDKIGGGIKGALSSPGVGDALIATGTRVMDEGFGGLGEGLREGMAELEVGRQEKKYKDTIEEVGFGMPDHEKSIMQSMPPAQGMEYLMNWRDSEKGRDARAAGLMDVLNIPSEMADTMAWDAATVDRILSRPNELQTITDGTGQTWVVDLSAGIDPEDRVAGGPIGAAKIDLTPQELALQERALNQAGASNFFDRIQSQYTENADKVRGLAALRVASDWLGETDADGNYVNEARFGPFNELKADLDLLMGSEKAVNRAALEQMLTTLGIQNLSNFKGAISEKELATALENAGTFGELRGGLLNLLNTAQARTKGVMDDHNADVARLRSIAGTEDYLLDRWELREDERLLEDLRAGMGLTLSRGLPEGSVQVASPGNSAGFGVRGMDRFRTRVP